MQISRKQISNRIAQLEPGRVNNLPQTFVESRSFGRDIFLIWNDAAYLPGVHLPAQAVIRGHQMQANFQNFMYGKCACKDNYYFQSKFSGPE